MNLRTTTTSGLRSLDSSGLLYSFTASTFTTVFFTVLSVLVTSLSSIVNRHIDILP